MIKQNFSKILLVQLIILVAASFFSCKKREIQGPKGEPGAPGGGGNANINNSSAFTIASSQWKPNADSTGWEVSINSDLITTAVAEKGVVKVFVLRNNSWWELPFTQGDLFTQFGFVIGKVNLEFVDIHGGLPERPETADYRIVVLSESARELPFSNTNEEKIKRESFN